MILPAISFDHLVALSSPLGLYEHAELAIPRLEHGFCLDDVARGLVVTSRQPEPSPRVRELTTAYLRFVVLAQDRHGAFRNRRSHDGSWQDRPSCGDHWGRAIWALGTAAAETDDDQVRSTALETLAIALRARSPWPRAMAYAALGAGELLRVRPDDPAALALLKAARVTVGRPAADPLWPWPERRLTYANAVLPEAMVVIGVALADVSAIRDGMGLLRWLLAIESHDGRLSVTPAGGWQIGEPRSGLDQQPIEVAALAEACWRAFVLTENESWLEAVRRAAGWFTGSNDAGLALYDPQTGGGFDGLHADAVNLNQGAESTLAALSTLQIALRAAPVGAS